MRGVINLRGTVLPVMDLAARLDMPIREHTDRNVIIVVKHKDIMMGLLVDAVSDIIALTDQDLQPPPEMTGCVGNNVIKALTLVEERTIRVLELSQIIDTDLSEAA